MNASIGGNIYFSIGDQYFPEEDHYDLLSSVLKMWLPDFRSFAQQHTDSCTLRFMDAPAYIILKREATTVTATCYYAGRLVVPVTVVDFDDLSKSFEQCVSKYNRYLHQLNQERTS